MLLHSLNAPTLSLQAFLAAVSAALAFASSLGGGSFASAMPAQTEAIIAASGKAMRLIRAPDSLGASGLRARLSGNGPCGGLAGTLGRDASGVDVFQP